MLWPCQLLSPLPARTHGHGPPPGRHCVVARMAAQRGGEGRRRRRRWTRLIPHPHITLVTSHSVSSPLPSASRAGCRVVCCRHSYGGASGQRSIPAQCRRSTLSVPMRRRLSSTPVHHLCVRDTLAWQTCRCLHGPVMPHALCSCTGALLSGLRVPPTRPTISCMCIPSSLMHAVVSSRQHLAAASFPRWADAHGAAPSFCLFSLLQNTISI